MLSRRALLASAPAVLGGQTRRPNILFLLADDWDPVAGAYRDPARPSLSDVVKTPHLDRIAGEGVRFLHAFMATPSCTPSRAAIATGCYSWRTGRTANLRGGEWNGVVNPGDRLPGFGALLERSGYLVRNSFKTLASNWLGGRAIAKRDFLRYSLYLSEAADDEARSERRAQIVEQARHGIRATLAERKAGQPFCYVYGPIHVHRPWARGSGKKLWGIDPDALRGKVPPFLPDNPIVREDLADYLGEIQALDLLAGCFLEELRGAGELDNTMFVLTGDNGIGGMPRGKCNLYDFGTRAPLLIRWPGAAAGGRTIDSFVNLMDLAPTFLEAAGLPAPASMNGRSLVPLLRSNTNGAAGPARDFVVTSRERHVADARAGRLPYPSRAIRTRDYLYIRNFKPDRSPMGDPAPDHASLPFERLASELVTYKDMDASPTKAWILTNPREGSGKYFDLAFGRRPAEELYDLRSDPDQVRNVAGETAHAAAKSNLAGRLEQVMREAEDPRLTDAFDRAPWVERA